MTDDIAGTRLCEVCGGPIRLNNRSGVCTINLQCLRERDRRASEGKRIRTVGRQKCKHPDSCPRYVHSYGWCYMHWKRMGRKEGGDPGSAESLKTPVPLVSAGDTFGSWTALESGGGPGNQAVPCRCECGNLRRITAPSLLQQIGKTCHCGDRYGSPPGRPMNKRSGRDPYLSAGATFGRLTVLEDVYYSKDKVRCACECGAETTPVAGSLKVRQTRSCGCIQITHGLSKHPLYCTWRSMVDRCINPKAQCYADYGGRGIKVCEEWVGAPDGLLRFIEYTDRELGLRPGNWSLDRINNDGGYEPGNLRWASKQRQLVNRRSIAKLTRERDALLVGFTEQTAEIAELKAELAMLRAPRPARRREPRLAVMAAEPLF